MTAAPRRVCWWGKLPARGDFIGRGLPARWRSDWDEWLQRGLAVAAATLEARDLQERLRAFAPWRYVAVPAPGQRWCGIIAASHDRAGRVFPLTLVERVDGRVAEPSQAAACAARLASLLLAAYEGPEALEAAIAALPPPCEPLSSAIAEADAKAPGSLWWPLAAAADAAPLVASWPPEPQLLLEVLRIPQGVEH